MDNSSVSDRLEERFRKMKDSYAPVKEEDKGRKPLIGQVPTFLHEKTELRKYFKPRIVSIGPVHHGKEELEKGQQYKLELTNILIEESEKSSPPKEELYYNILKEIQSFKECYDQELLKKFQGNDEDLAWMFFVDGCALIQFVSYYGRGLLLWRTDPMETDLILLDNQLPLGVLNLVVKFINKKDNLGILIRDFAIGIMEMMHFEGWAKDEQADIRTDLIFGTENHMLELIWMNFIQKDTQFISTDFRIDNTKTTYRQFRSVKDLQAAGIILEPKNSRSPLIDISFNQGTFFCKLKIPSFRVSEEGKFLLFNLIAFEMHFHKYRPVTSYISFLNSLVATKEDVAELRNTGILFNYLPNDEEVLKTFQELTSSLTPYQDIFFGTKEKVINYFNDKKSMTIGKWLSEAMHVYFRSSWTTIAFVSATLLLILTIIQTIFSILAYHHR